MNTSASLSSTSPSSMNSAAATSSASSAPVSPFSTSSSAGTEAAIAPGLQAVIELFDTELGQLKFPDVDQAVLREAAERVLAQTESVAAAEHALSVAREGLGDAQELLLSKCQRALAYARVYAEEDRELSRKLDAISLPRSRAKTAPSGPSEPAEPKPGRRGRRSPPASGPLFLEPSGGPAADDAAAVESCAA